MSSVSSDLTAEIEAAVDQVVAEGESQNEVQAEEAAEVVNQEAQEATEGAEDTSSDSGMEEAHEDGALDAGGDSAEAIQGQQGQEEDSDTLPSGEADQVVISDEALTRAVNVGIPLSQARNFPDEGSLQTAVDSLDRAAEFMVEQAQAAEQPAEQPPEDTDPFAALPKLDPEDGWDPDTVAYLDKLTGVMRQQLQQQHDELQGFRAQQEQAVLAQQAVVQQELEQRFDKQVAALGDDFKQALGEGGWSALRQGGKEWTNRQAIVDQMEIVVAGHVNTGRQQPSFEDAFDQAAMIVLHDEFQKAREVGLASKLEKRSTQHIQRPGSQQATKVLTAEEETVKLLGEKFDIPA